MDEVLSEIYISKDFDGKGRLYGDIHCGRISLDAVEYKQGVMFDRFYLINTGHKRACRLVNVDYTKF